MAWLFSLSAECGLQKEAAEQFAAHFQRLTVMLADGSRFPCQVDTFHDGEGWCARICPDGVSRSGIRHEQDARQMTEIGSALYERLRSAPPFRFAMVGVEVDGFRTFSELDADVVDCDSFEGLVLGEPGWRLLGAPSVFVPFAPGYWWRPFVRGAGWRW